MLGLFAFFYAVAHLTIYLVLDQGFAFEFILADVAKRPFITAGMVAFLLMVPLAVTSTQGLDPPARAALAAAAPPHLYLRDLPPSLHFLWKVKVVIGEPVYYAAALAVLLGFRFVWQAPHAGRRPAATRAGITTLGPFHGPARASDGA